MTTAELKKKVRKLIVSESKSKSDRIAKSFGLKNEEWRCAAFGDTLAGARFSEIVVFWPSPVPDHYETWYDKVICTKLPPGKKPVNF